MGQGGKFTFQYYPDPPAHLLNKQNLTIMTTKQDKQRKQPTLAKRWCFTLNNPKAPIQFNEVTMDYLVYGNEVGESGTPHHQGFVVFKQQKRIGNLKDINGLAHWEIANGTNQQAADYCKKDGDFVEFGTLPLDPRVAGTKLTKRNGEQSMIKQRKEILSGLIRIIQKYLIKAIVI